MAPVPTVDRPTTDSGRSDRLGAAILILAGLCFAVYPPMRGSGSELGIAGAELYARPEWVIAHGLAMIGFVCLAWVLPRLDRLAGIAAQAALIGLLPYYGAETFALHAIGVHAVASGDAAGVAAADLFRYQPVAMIIFAIGLLLLATAGLRLLIMIRSRPGWARFGLLITGLCLIGYLPQFFFTPAGRILHGVLLGVGLLILGVTVGVARAATRAEGSLGQRHAANSGV